MRSCVKYFAFAFAMGMVAIGYAQQAKPSAAADASKLRALAPHVMISIDPRVELSETVARHDVVELRGFDWAKDIPFRRDIWFLQFKFKPMRIIWVDVPVTSTKMDRKMILYMVYSVTNPGKALHPVQNEDGTYRTDTVDLPIRFIPRFSFEIPKLQKAYPDRFVPMALGPIQQREDPGRRLLTSDEMPLREIAPGDTVWGVATWEDIDPRFDRFSIFVNGLTNAYQWYDDVSKIKEGAALGAGRTLAQKTLKINFWRPGDDRIIQEDQIRYGAPGEVDYEWIYR